MYEDPKIFPVQAAAEWPGSKAQPIAASKASSLLLPGLQVAAVFALIEAAVWTPVGVLGATWIFLASFCILGSLWMGGASGKGLGLAVPDASSSVRILLISAILSIAIPAVSISLGYRSGPVHVLPWQQACVYAIWAVLQQFILQSFFFLRLETLLGGRRAVWVSAILFAAVHVPNPVLTAGSFLGGLFFCEMFRRHRNIFPLGVAHAMMGLTVAASFSDAVLRHMLVGEAYLNFHP